MEVGLSDVVLLLCASVGLSIIEYIVGMLMFEAWRNMTWRNLIPNGALLVFLVYVDFTMLVNLFNAVITITH